MNRSESGTDGEDRLDHEGVVRFKGLAVRFSEGSAELLLGIVQASTQGECGEVEAAGQTEFSDPYRYLIEQPWNRAYRVSQRRPWVAVRFLSSASSFLTRSSSVLHLSTAAISLALIFCSSIMNSSTCSLSARHKELERG